MQIEFAYVPGTNRRAIGVIVSVQHHILGDSQRREALRSQLGQIADFRGLPIVLAATEGSRLRYHGADWLVQQLARIDALALPWRTATLQNA